MNRRTTIAIGLGLALSVGIVAGIVGGSAPLLASATDATDHANENTMTETEFQWGTVIAETDSETGETHVELLVETEAPVSVSATTTPDATDEATAADREGETETFEWGAVTSVTDSETGEADVDVLLEPTAGVSIAVTDDSSQSEATTTVRTGNQTTGGDGAETSTDVSVSQSASGTNASVTSSTSVSQSSTASGDDSVSISIDDDGDS